MFVNDRVVVKVHSDRFISIPADVVLRRVLPPVVKSAVMVRIEKQIVESQTETGTGQSVRPYLCVFTMATHLPFLPLFSELPHHTGMRPSKRVFAITDHLKRVVPLRIV